MLAGGLVGLGYLTKMLQAFVVLPVFALAYLVAGPPRVGRRVWQLLVALAAVVVSAGWWVAVVELWPASSRPLIGGSTTDSILQLTFGYNGLGRLTGNETGAVGGGGAPPFWGSTGLLRLFTREMGGEISWLLPAALVALAAGVTLAVAARNNGSRAPARGRMLRGGLLVWGGWLLLTGLLFSFAAGIIHPYYNVVLAPAIGALLGMVVPQLWDARGASGGGGRAARAVLGAMVLGTAVWADVLLGRTPQWLPGLRFAILAAGVVGAVALVAVGGLSGSGWRRALAAGIASVALIATLGGSAAYAFATAARPHTGPIPASGPSAVDWGFGPGGPGFGRGGRAGPFAGGGNLPGARQGRGNIPVVRRGALPGVGGLPNPGNLPGNVPGGFAFGFPGGPGTFEEGTVAQGTRGSGAPGCGRVPVGGRDDLGQQRGTHPIGGTRARHGHRRV